MSRALFRALAMLLVVLGTGVAMTAETKSTSSASEAETPQSPSPNLTKAALPSTDEDAAAEAALLESINRSRREAGVAPLRIEESLRQAALLHGRRMVAAGRLEHRFPDEPGLLQRIADVSRLRLDRAGENIADVTCAGDAHELLMHSPPHRQNILNPQFDLAGIAAIWTNGRLYIVQDFAHAMPSYSAHETKTLVEQAVADARAEAGLNELESFSPPHLDDAACTLAQQGHPNARIVAASYSNRKVITYTQSRPEILPPGALRLIHNSDVHQFAVGSCYARNAAYPTGIYWVAILLY